MTLTEQLADYVNAACSGLYVQSSEPDEAEREIAALARQREWTLAAWDVASGLRFPDAPQATATDLGTPGRDDDYGYGLIQPRDTLRGLGLLK